jgi:hypothetical protein
VANTAKVLFRGTATTNLATVLYTVPSATSTVVTNIAVTNASDSATTFSISLNGHEYLSQIGIDARGIVTFDLKQVLVTTNTITGGATTASALKFHISGMEIA